MDVARTRSHNEPAQQGLTLRLFGTPAFEGEGAATASGILLLPKRLALLVYLTASLPRGFRRRDELLAMLWPESDTHHARNSLRQSLHLLRSSLPDNAVVTRGSEEVSLCPRTLRLDTESFEWHLDHGREAEALAFYVGDFLQGCHLAESRAFEGWVEGERGRLGRRAVRAAIALAQRCQLNNDCEGAAKWAHFAERHSQFDGGSANAGNGVTVTATPFVPAVPVGPRGPRAVSPEARRLYIEARQYSAQRSPATIRRAIDVFSAALRLAPGYAEAHSGLAFALVQAAVYVDYPGIEAWPRVQDHATRAITLDPTLGEAHAMLAQATLCQEFDWTAAERMYRRALALDPVSDTSRQALALYLLTASGRTEEALDVLDRARDLTPHGPGLSTLCAMACVYGRQFARARDEVVAVLSVEPTFVQAHWVHGMALEGLGDGAGAVAAFERGVELTNRSSLLLSQLGRACAEVGQAERAEAILAELEARGEVAGPAAYYRAEILAAMGRREEAIERLYTAYRQRNPVIIFAGVLPGLDPLRGERRFRELLLRIRLPRLQ